MRARWCYVVPFLTLILATLVIESACAQDANNPAKFNLDVGDTTDTIIGDAVNAGDQLVAGSEKALENEAQRDVQPLKAAAPTVAPSSRTPTTDQEIEAEVEGLQRQADEL